MAITVCEFLKILWGNMPSDPLEPCFYTSTCFKLILPEKTTLEKMPKFRAFSLKKFLLCLRHETFSKGLFTLRFFLRLDVYPFLHIFITVGLLINIQPNSKAHPLTKVFRIHSWPEASMHKLKMCKQNASYLVKDTVPLRF